MPRIGRNSILLSFRKGTHGEVVSRFVRRGAEALAAFGLENVVRFSIDENTVLLTTWPLENLDARGDSFVLLHGIRALSRQGTLLTATDLLKNFLNRGNECFSALVPPFAVIAGNAHEMTAASDSIGSVHLYFWQGDLGAVVASSAALIGRVFELPYNFDCIFQRMTVGHCIGDATAFLGVEVLPPGTRAEIAKGQIFLRCGTPENQTPIESNAVDAGRDAIRGIVHRCLAAVPDCGIELSGGLDSRMILAAIPTDLRAGRKAYTIGYPDTPDVDIGKKLAARCKLDHVFVNLSDFADESVEATWYRARRIAYRDDFETNILDRLTLDCIDDVLLTCPRIGGVNGELARGFYYPMLDINAVANKTGIDRLIDWRLTVNDAAPRALFVDAYLSRCDANLHTKVTAELENGPQPFGNALDWFYLRQRMRHWAGAEISRTVSNRIVLAPFFHPEYVGWAMHLPPADKKDSFVFSYLLRKFDPELASIPLDTRLIPSQLAKRNITSRIALLNNKFHKLVLKFSQVFGSTSRPILGSSQFYEKLCRSEVIEQIDWNFLHSIPLFSSRGLEFLRARKLPWNRTSLGYIVSMHFQHEYLGLPVRKKNIHVIEYVGKTGVDELP